MRVLVYFNQWYTNGQAKFKVDVPLNLTLVTQTATFTMGQIRD